MIRALFVLAMLASAAHAETRRVAVVVGNNTGNADQAPLRYAEVDASKIGRVLVELGGIAADDLFLLQGKNLATLEATLTRAKDKITAYQRGGLDRVVVLFYFSGHSDGVALELGRDRYTFAALRRWLSDTGADVRVALVDACKSGALLATKGGTPGPAFQIRLSDDLASTGEALLTSSAADENALESKEIGGSFFTHHLVFGLRGAADTSGDGRVTLSEAYQYAYKHTIATSGATLAGTQHPAYDYRLSGQGELILTELAEPTAVLALPDGFDRALVIEAAHEQVIAELGRGAPARVAVVPGRYGVRAWKSDKVFEGRVVVAANAVHAVGWDELRAVDAALPRAKGDSGERGLMITGALGIRGAVADPIGAIPAARISIGRGRDPDWVFAAEVGTASTNVVRETAAYALVGHASVVELGRFRLWLGMEAGLGAVVQATSSTSWSGTLVGGPNGGVSVGITRSLALALAGDSRGALLRKDGSLTAVFVPAGWLGIVVTR
jgi:hypothetical protein